MNGLLAAAQQLRTFCDEQRWRSCFIGGLAVQRWGEPRVTLDIDLALLTGFGGEEKFIEALLDTYPGRISDAAEFALRHRVVLLRTPEGVGIDVSLAALPFEQEVIRRATLFSFAAGLEIRTCSAEDLMVMKLFASRPLDIRDAESVALRQKGRLEWRYIEDQLRPLAEVKEDASILDACARLRAL